MLGSTADHVLAKEVFEDYPRIGVERRDTQANCELTVLITDWLELAHTVSPQHRTFHFHTTSRNHTVRLGIRARRNIESLHRAPSSHKLFTDSAACREDTVESNRTSYPPTVPDSFSDTDALERPCNSGEHSDIGTCNMVLPRSAVLRRKPRHQRTRLFAFLAWRGLESHPLDTIHALQPLGHDFESLRAVVHQNKPPPLFERSDARCAATSEEI